MSTPFQVVTPSLRGTKNPFEKLSSTPSLEASKSLLTGYAALNITEEQNDDAQHASATATVTTNDLSSESEEDDVDIDTDLLEGDRSAETMRTLMLKSDQQGVKKPRLQEALEMSLRHSSSILAKEVQAPEISNTKKKPGTIHKTSASIPIDWTLKSSISITSPDSMIWCDHNTPLDEIDALNHFIARQKTFGCSQNESELNLEISPRTQILSATYHWIYPTNTPSVIQAQNISKLLKNASSMSSNDKISITEVFSRSIECSASISGEMEAILTNSTPGLWKALKDEDINYVQLPALGGKVAVAHFSSKHDLDHMEDQDQDETSVSSQSTSYQLPSMKELSSTLLFKGQIDLHGLFSYLLNAKTSYEDGFLYQSPSLIAGVPFLHAALKRAQVSKCKVVSRPIQGTDRMQKEYRIEIHGIVLPNSAKDLYGVFAAQQRPIGFACTSSSDTRSHGLNLRPLHTKSPESKTDTNADDACTEGAFVSAKSLDQFRYDYTLQQYAWLT
ncbi:hypothetical protein FBU30_006882 [Linnemannia zychae]|nr:hypothetical protein FBU30_006882 [Linnemannia zychae]